jgi:phosphonate transport system permease protein
VGRTGIVGGDPVNEGGWTLFLEFVEAAFHPELSGRFLALTLEATLVTLGFAVLGTLLSLVIGTVGGVLSSETWWRSVMTGRGGPRRLGFRTPWLTVRGLLALPRGIHEIIWGVLLVEIFGLDPLVGVLAIGIPFGAIVAKVYSEILDEADRRPYETLRSAGASTPKAFLYGLVPEALPDLVSYAFYRLECSIRSAAVLGIIGAGGLGYQIFLSLQSLRYQEMWTFLGALILLTGLTDLWSGVVRRRLGSPHRIEITTGDDGGGTFRRGRGDPVIRGTWLGIGALAVFSLVWVDAGWGKLLAGRTWGLAADLARDAWPPALGAGGLGGMIDASADTLAMSVLAIVIAGIGGLLLSFPAANNFFLPGGVLRRSGAEGERRWPGALAFGLTRAALLFFRAVPAPIWALVFLLVLFPGILPGAVALGVYTLGVLGRLMAEVTENLDARPLRALKAQGASGAQIFLYGVLPATVPRNTAYLLYRWEVAIRATAMVGLVGAGGLGRLLQEQMSSFDYSAVLGTLIFYVGLTFLVDMVSALARRDLR